MDLANPAYMLLNGVPVIEATNITREFQSNDKPIYTNILGLAGFSNGPNEVTINVTNAVPKNPSERVDWEGVSQAHADVDIGFKLGTGLIRYYRGRVVTGSDKSGANEPAENSFSFHGRRVS